MPVYRNMFFQGGRLERWEEVEAPTVLEAITEASKQPFDGYVEIWNEGGRVALLRPAGQSHKS